MLMYGKEFQNLRGLLKEVFCRGGKSALKFNVSGRFSTSYIMRN